MDKENQWIMAFVAMAVAIPVSVAFVVVFWVLSMVG